MKTRIIVLSVLTAVLSVIAAPQGGNDLTKQVARQTAAIKQLGKAVVALKKANADLSDSMAVKSRRSDQELRRMAAAQVVMQARIDSARMYAAERADSLAKSNLKKMRGLQSNVRLYFFFSLFCMVVMLALAIYIIGRMARNFLFFDSDVSRGMKIVTRLFSAVKKKEEGEEAVPLPPELERPAETDHEFHLKVVEEMHRMRVRIERMPPETKGVAALLNALQRLGDELRIKGYEIIDLTGQDYNDGMTALVRDFIPMDDIPRGVRRIVRTLKPQVRYRDQVISHGEIEVAMSDEDLASK